MPRGLKEQTPPFVRHRPELEGRHVKSAERVVQILELFDDLKKGATVAEVAGKLRLPQSSTSVLLHSLVDLGYLHYDPARRAFAPSIRVALLGKWIDPMIVRDGPIVDGLRSITNETGLLTFLGVRNQIHFQIIYYQYGLPPPAYFGTGSGGRLIESTTGTALLAGTTDEEIIRIIMATNSRLEPEETPFSRKQVLDKVAAVRRAGYAAGPATRDPGRTSIAIPFLRSSGEPIAIGISLNPACFAGSPEELVALARDVMARQLGEER